MPNDSDKHKFNRQKLLLLTVAENFLMNFPALKACYLVNAGISLVAE
jgi:hypothetical protein